MKVDHNFKKKFGQNFITSTPYILKTIDRLELKDDDTVLEIGPGDGRFTEAIIEKVQKMNMVEIDYDLIEYLNTKFEDQSSKFKIFNEDIMNFELSRYKGKKYKVFGALPYNISKMIIKKFLEAEHKPELMVFVIQKEVAKDYTTEAPRSMFLYNFANCYSDTKYEFTIPKDLFHPKPKVDGGVLSFKNFGFKFDDIEDSEQLVKFIKNGFRNPRKKLLNTLKSIYKETEWKELLSKLEFNDNIRAAELELEQWVELYRQSQN